MKETVKNITLAAIILAVLAAVPSCRKDRSGHTGGREKPAAVTVQVFDRGTDGGKTNPANNASVKTLTISARVTGPLKAGTARYWTSAASENRPHGSVKASGAASLWYILPFTIRTSNRIIAGAAGRRRNKNGRIPERERGL